MAWRGVGRRKECIPARNLAGTNESSCYHSIPKQQERKLIGIWCESGGNKECISHSQLCNGGADCDDEGDEKCSNVVEEGQPYCVLRTSLNSTRQKKSGFWCEAGRKCILVSQLCDGVKNCGDGKDEQCSNQNVEDSGQPYCFHNISGYQKTGFWCESGGKQTCILPEKICDGEQDCDRAEDEQCTNINVEGSREPYCFHNISGYQKTGFLCESGGKQTCILPEKICNGEQDCDKGEDEQCTVRIDVLESGEPYCYHNVTGYPKTGFWCEASGRQKCIPPEMLCNGKRDCDEGEDEECSTLIKNERSACYHTLATKRETKGYWCEIEGKAKCRPVSLRCNGNIDCITGPIPGIDEKDCPWFATIPTYGTFLSSLGIVLFGWLVYWGISRCFDFGKKKTTAPVTSETEPRVSRYNVINDFMKLYTEKESSGVLQLAVNLAPGDRDRKTRELEGQIRITYLRIHQQGLNKQLLKCLKIFITDVEAMHKVTNTIIYAEKVFHQDSMKALQCLRFTCGSNVDTERFLCFRNPPGLTQKTSTKISVMGLDSIWNTINICCNQNIKMITKSFIKFITTVMKVTLYLWDTVKDLFLWAILYTKKDEIDNTLLWIFFASIFLAQMMVGVLMAVNNKKIITSKQKTWQRFFVVLLMFLLAPFTPSFVMLKATLYNLKINQLIAEARQDGTSKPSCVLESLEEIEMKQFVNQRFYAFSRMIESTLETGIQFSITITIIIQNDVLIDSENLYSRTSLFIYGNMLYSVLNIGSAVVSFINVNKRDSIGLIAKMVLGVAYLFQVGASIMTLVIAFDLATKEEKRPEIFYLMTAGFAIKWTLQSIFIFFGPFKAEAPISDKLLHILANTLATVPFRYLEDEKQISKTSEIFWNMVLNSVVFSAIILGSGILANDTLVTKLSPLPVCLHLLSGLFLYLYYRRFHPWREVFDTRINCCCNPYTRSTSGFCLYALSDLLACLQLIFIPVFFCTWWLKWCDCCGVNNFAWLSPDLEETAIPGRPLDMDEWSQQCYSDLQNFMEKKTKTIHMLSPLEKIEPDETEKKVPDETEKIEPHETEKIKPNETEKVETDIATKTQITAIPLHCIGSAPLSDRGDPVIVIETPSFEIENLLEKTEVLPVVPNNVSTTETPPNIPTTTEIQVILPEPPVIVPDTTVIVPETPVFVQETPVTVPETPVIVQEPTIIVPETPVIVPESTVIVPDP